MLVIRDTVVEWRLGIASIVMLGLAYGIYNEGIVAKTLLHAEVPVPSFNHYAFFGGVNFSWLVSILIWHACHSVLYPILLTFVLWPGTAEQLWLGRKTKICFLAISGLVGTLIFFVRRHLLKCRL